MSHAVRNNAALCPGGTDKWKLYAKIHCQQIATNGASMQTTFNQTNGLRETAQSCKPRMTTAACG